MAFRFTILLLISMVETYAMAIPWRLDDQSRIPIETLNKLKSKYLDINSEFETTALLQEIADSGSYQSIGAKVANGSLIVHAKKSKIIREIQLNLSPSTLQRKVSAKLVKFVNFADSEATKDQVEGIIRTSLQETGYYEPDVKFQTEQIDGNNIKYNIDVSAGIPCLIREINFKFKKPKRSGISISVGDICDSLLIKMSVNEIEARFREEGFNQINLNAPTIEYDKNSHSAAVIFTGNAGYKVGYDVKYASHQSEFSTVYNINDLNKLDSNVTSPDTMWSQLMRNYKDAGFDEVKISDPIKSMPDKETINYVFTIDPGPRYGISEVQIEGLTAISQANALEKMDLIPRLGNTVVFTRNALSKGIADLKTYYQSLGYWDAEIEYPRVAKRPENGTVSLIFIVNEGKKRIIRNIEITGNEILSKNEIMEFFGGELESPLLKSDLIDFERNLIEKYKKLGNLYAKISVDLLLDRKYRDIQTTVKINIDEGPIVRVGDISIQGLIKTKSDLVTKALRFKSGDAYNPDAIKASRQDIMSLGLFSFVSIRPSDPGDVANQKPILDYLVVVTESKPGMVAFGPAWSLNEGGRFSFETSYLNLKGMGTQIFFKGAVIEERDQTPFGGNTLLGRDLGVSLLEPYFLNSPFNASVSLNHRAEADKDIWEISRSVELSLKHDFRHPLPESSITVFSLLRSTRIETENDSSQLILISKDDVQIRELGIRYMLDSRNSISWPTKGIIFRGEVARAAMVLGGDTAYIRFSNSIGIYQQVSDSLVFAIGLGTDTYRGIRRQQGNADILPASEVFKSGGANTNRGFKENELGPILRYVLDDGATKSFNTGGSQRFSLKTELRHQIIEDTAAMSVFIDLGNTFFSNKEKSIIDQKLSTLGAKLYDNEPYEWDEVLYNPRALWEKNYLSYGLAFSYLSPLGSINLSYGFPLKRCLSNNDCIARGNEDYKSLTGGQVHISVGATF